jgi:hypothetical protein
MTVKSRLVTLNVSEESKESIDTSVVSLPQCDGINLTLNVSACAERSRNKESSVRTLVLPLIQFKKCPPTTISTNYIIKT